MKTQSKVRAFGFFLGVLFAATFSFVYDALSARFEEPSERPEVQDTLRVRYGPGNYATYSDTPEVREALRESAKAVGTTFSVIRDLRERVEHLEREMRISRLERSYLTSLSPEYPPDFINAYVNGLLLSQRAPTPMPNFREVADCFFPLDEEKVESP